MTNLELTDYQVLDLTINFNVVLGTLLIFPRVRGVRGRDLYKMLQVLGRFRCELLFERF